MNYDQLPSGLKRLGAEIREVRKARGLTLQDMSDAVSCSVAYLSRIERGSARVSSELLTEISAALAVDTEWFFPLEEGLDRWNASMLSGQATAALFRACTHVQRMSWVLKTSCCLALCPANAT